MDFTKQILEKIKLESLIPYLDNTVYLIAFLVILTLLIYFFLSLLLKLFFKGFKFIFLPKKYSN